MKTKQIIVCGFFAVILVLAFTACLGSGGGGKSINSATELKEYLDKQPANSPDKPIKVAMKVNEMMIKDIAKVISEAGKYVSLNLTGSPLTEIPKDAFRDCKTLAGITIPEGVTSIGVEAFRGCTSLTSVTIPASLTTGAGEFSLPNLTDIKVAAGNPNYVSEGGILYNKTKTELIFAVKGIKGSITIPADVTSIGYSAFDNCTGITSVIIPESVTSIGDGMFSGCTSLTSVTIPEGVTFIGNRAFYDCTNLTSITIPASVRGIGHSAFAYCTNLTSITIPASVRGIGNSAFNSWTASQTINVQGKANGWDYMWNYNCNAKINYNAQ
jgi:hypothetical protein